MAEVDGGPQESRLKKETLDLDSCIKGDQRDSQDLRDVTVHNQCMIRYWHSDDALAKHRVWGFKKLCQSRYNPSAGECKRRVSHSNISVSLVLQQSSSEFVDPHARQGKLCQRVNWFFACEILSPGCRPVTLRQSETALQTKWTVTCDSTWGKDVSPFPFLSHIRHYMLQFPSRGT